MSDRTITCQDCGHDYKTARKNTKYCRVCRLVRNLGFLKNTVYKCFVCGEKYAPLAREPEDWRVCGTCSPGDWKQDTQGHCALCDEDTEQLIHPDIAVCRKCATDPEKRGLFFKALILKQKTRKEAGSASV